MNHTTSGQIGADADYAAAGFGQGLVPGRQPALLMIDFARAYFVPDSALYAGVEAARDAAAVLLAAARRCGMPVFHTRVEYQPGGADGGVFFRKIAALKLFEAGSPLGDFEPPLEPAPGEAVITKQYPSAFFGTNLAEQLRRAGIDTLVIAGLSTSGCVRASAVDAICHGFVPLVVRDAVGDRLASVHEANLFDLAAKTAEIVSLGDAIAYFEGLAARKA
ncbi:isochorismatase family protein [Sandarakinorhabdus rubra]|uniref:isochorismatase family protein n=1 Tax=Sandarakinorhabdus rubra TaxID=2672568 RepID=UPI001F2DCB81|nr:isochorismatase family protein [Sandarakinorhabdus rubra]